MSNIQYAVCHLQLGRGSDSGMSCHIERKDHAGLHRKVGKNQTKAISIILTGTHEQMMKLQCDGKLDQWIKANLSWLKDTFGEENLVSCVLHMDEKTPHLHTTIIPIVTTERKLKEQHKVELAKYRNGYMAEIDKAIKRAEVAERKNIAHEATIEKQKQCIDALDRKANPHRHRLSSGATLTGIRRSPRYSSIPSLRIQTKVENETFEDVKYFEWYNPVIQKYLNGELTEYELVNEIFEPFEQVSQVQTQLLGATFEMLSGGPTQTHVGTGGGGSSSDMPWGEKKNDSNTLRRRR